MVRLRAVDTCTRVAGPQSIGINHVLHVVDAGTAAALGDPQGFLAAHFASVTKHRGDNGSGGSWVGTYITGRRGYIEIFDPSVLSGGAVHAQSGLLLGTDTTPSFEQLRSDLLAIKDPRFTVKADSFPPHPSPKNPVWIRYVELSPPVRQVFCWIMAYGEDYMRENYGEPKPGEPVDISRQRYNSATYNPQRYLDEITGVAVTLTNDELATLNALADRAGFTKAGNVYANDQLRIAVTVTNDQAMSGVTAITMSLSDNARRDHDAIADTTHVFGKAKLYIAKDCREATLSLPLMGAQAR